MCDVIRPAPSDFGNSYLMSADDEWSVTWAHVARHIGTVDWTGRKAAAAEHGDDDVARCPSHVYPVYVMNYDLACIGRESRRCSFRSTVASHAVGARVCARVAAVY